MSEYNPDHTGMGVFLESDMLMHVVETVAREIMARAMVNAPVGSPLGDEHAGRYSAAYIRTLSRWRHQRSG